MVETTPAGASVSTSNGYSCRSTPCAIKMPRRSEFVATIEKPGFETVEVNVTHQVSGAGGAGMAGNVLVGGLIGAAVDAGTGAMNDLVPNPIEVTLESVGQSEPELEEPESVSSPALTAAGQTSPERRSEPRPRTDTDSEEAVMRASASQSESASPGDEGAHDGPTDEDWERYSPFFRTQQRARDDG
ncbi:PEGA domain-containing protein [Marinicauda salina]|uniref:PEGA domain-containing protein n=1 Tax=Marinicauda salina TaxID=2135793 RepID=UPI001E58C19C|nr:PEGA domain-containing protein [Marinicauda salina]